jgi:hypothetical protein
MPARFMGLKPPLQDTGVCEVTRGEGRHEGATEGRKTKGDGDRTRRPVPCSTAGLASQSHAEPAHDAPVRHVVGNERQVAHVDGDAVDVEHRLQRAGEKSDDEATTTGGDSIVRATLRRLHTPRPPPPNRRRRTFISRTMAARAASTP